MPEHKNQKREAFLQEYLKDLNGQAAAIRAGYSKKTAARQAYDILNKDDEAKARLQELIEARNDRTKISQDDVVHELAKIAFGGLGRFIKRTAAGDPFIDISDVEDADLNLLSEVTIEDFTDGRGEDARDVRKIKIKTLDRLSALDKLARHLGVYADSEKRLGGKGSVGDLLAAINGQGSTLPTVEE